MSLRIPPEALSADVLDALVEEFVTRHGTDLTDAAQKVSQVRAQLQTGEIVIVWDDQTESANIVHKDAKEEPPPPDEPPPVEIEEPRPPRQRPAPRAGPTDEDGRHIVDDEPAAPDPTDY